MARVELEHVWKIYPGAIEAAKDIHFVVEDKQFCVLVGPSGCGKTTTLRMIAGLEEISKGTIKIGDKIVNDIPPKDRDIAMVFQNYALYPHMSVYENLAFGLRLRKYDAEEIHKRVSNASDILGLDDLLERKPKALSGGQRQRVAVGRCIVRNPKCFLFDEPLSNLDAKLRVEMRAELNKLHKRLATTMIYVTHDQIEAMTLADVIIIMKLGLIQQMGKPLAVYDNPINEFVAGFLGTPPMNFIDGKIENKDGDIVFVYDDGAVLPLSDKQKKAVENHHGKTVRYGIRPENLEDAAYATRQKEDVDAIIKATVEVIEPLGYEMVLYLITAGGQTFILKEDAHHEAKRGTEMSIRVASSKAHIFDVETGDNLTYVAS